MKNIALTISAVLLSVFAVNAQDNIYVMKNGTATYTIPVTQVDSIIFYAPGTGGGGGGTGTGSKCGDYTHVTKNPQTPATSTTSQIIYQNDFSAGQNSGANAIVLYNASYDNPALTARGSATFNGQAVVSIQTPAPSYNDAWHISLSQYLGGISFTKNDNYEFSVDMKTTGPDKVITVVVQENGVDSNQDNDNYSGVLGKDFLVTGTMKTFTCKWRPHVTTPNTRLLLWVGGDATGLTIDNIKITRTGNSPTPGTITTDTGLPEFDCATAVLTEGNGTDSDFNKPGAGSNAYKKHYNYNSPATGTTVGLDIVLPPDYATNTSKRYPVIYYLHGHGETEETITWNNIDKAVFEGMNNNNLDDVILVSIGGPAKAWWSDGDNGVKAESHIIYEILPLVDAKFRTIGTKNSRAIMGFSMGGWGAAKLGVKYPGFFKTVMTWCGALYSPGPVGASLNGGFWDGITSIVDGKPYPGFAEDYTAIWSDNADDYAYDCARAMAPVQATKIKQEGVKFFIHENIGNMYLSPTYRYDDQFMKHSNDFVRELQGLGIQVEYSESLCVNDFYTGIGSAGAALAKDSAPHSPKNITAADIQKMLSIMQVN